MALPIIETPRYELTLPSSDVQVQFRPFIVKEEKILLIAMESKDNNEIINATKEVLKACTYDKLDIDKLPCLLYTSPSPRDGLLSRMPSSA